jgi:hypothetical protein
MKYKKSVKSKNSSYLVGIFLVKIKVKRFSIEGVEPPTPHLAHRPA